MSRVADRWREDRLLLTGLAAVIAVLGVSLLVFSGRLPRDFGKQTTTVRAVFADTSELFKGADVRVDGVNKGKVSKVSVDPGGRSATVEMTLDRDAAPLYRDARADIRWKLILGGNVAVVLSRGTSSAGMLDSAIPLRRTSTQVELDDITAALQDDQKAGLKAMIPALGDALSDRAALGRTLGTLSRVAPSVARGVGALRGERDRELRSLVSSAARTVKALDSPGDVQDLIEGAATTFATTARREADVRGTIREADATLPPATRTLLALRTTLGIADPLVAKLRAPARDVAPTTAALRPVAIDAARLLVKAQPLLHALRPAATSLRRASAAGRPLLDELAGPLHQLDRDVLPRLAKRIPESGRASYELVGAAVAGVNGAAARFDGVSNLMRFPVSGGERAVDTPPCKTFLTDPTAAELLRCQSLMGALERYWGGIRP